MILADFIDIRKRLNDAAVSDGAIRGTLNLVQDDKEILGRLVEAGCCEEYGRVGATAVRVAEANVGDSLAIELHPSNVTDGKYYENVDKFITSNQLDPPSSRFYIHAEDFDSDAASQENRPLIIQRFDAVMRLVNYLKSMADYRQDRDLVFIGQTALILKVAFEQKDLPSDFTKLNALVDHLEIDAQRKERKALFVSVISQVLKGVLTKSQRFIYILANLKDIDEEYRKSHQLYIDQFSFHKVKAELDKELLDLGDKIQGVINDAQTKLIAIPAAFVLLVTSFDFSGENLARNGALVLAALIFSILIQILLANQFASLNFIKDAIDRFKTSLDAEKADILSGALKTSFAKVKGRRECQKRLLIGISILVWLTFILSILLYAYSVNEYLSKPFPLVPSAVARMNSEGLIES